MESNLRSRVAEFEAGYFLTFVFFFCKPALSLFFFFCRVSQVWRLVLGQFRRIRLQRKIRHFIPRCCIRRKEGIVLFCKLLWRYELVSVLVMCFGRSNGCYSLSAKLCIYTIPFLFFLTGLICLLLFS